MKTCSWHAGVARRVITPPPGVELAGLGYYLGRTWERVRDPLHATALVVGDGDQGVAFVALDLMYNDARFSRRVRELAAAQTGLRPEAICVNCSHSHSAPTAGLILGGGERDEAYLDFAAREAAGAVIEAWRNRAPAKLFAGHSELTGMTFNRTRENGPTDNRVSVLRADAADGRPLAVVVNFHSHCTAHMEADLRAVSRDWPGEVVDQLEAALPGVTAMYLQGTCGDVNFRREFNGMERRFEPARAVTRVALDALAKTRPVEQSGVAAFSETIALPTRRWTREEILREREEGLHRLATGDTTGWLEGVARVCVNQPERLPLRYGGIVEQAVAAVARFAVAWTDLILPELETRPEILETEVQALRVGDVYFAANAAELFTSFGLEVRRRWPHDDLFMLGYSNGGIGYLPDAHDIERRSYAAIQSPKFTGQFQFTEKSGAAMVAGLAGALEKVAK
ncbi:MAG: hypothetical protein EXS35_08620 [Pedosphaera sp.]|nr:hypothetical protein [Pedosphaera sp.]